MLYSVVPPDKIDAVYGRRLTGTQIVPTLTGYVPDGLEGVATIPMAARTIDVGYRGRSAPMWLGRLAFEKIEIGRGFRERAPVDLLTDIAWTENKRIYGPDWLKWLGSCRATLASESGASIVDYDGHVELAVQRYVADHPTAAYAEVEREVLSVMPPTPTINAVSPRLFEAAALRTALILFPGEYSGVVRAEDHYIPLEKDFSNLDVVVNLVRDTAFLEQLTERAHKDLIASGRYSYPQFINEFDDHLEARVVDPTSSSHTGRLGLKLEQLATGRSYWISAGYGLVRQGLLLSLLLRHAIRTPALRSLVRRALRVRHGPTDDASLWNDVLRIALLRGIVEGDVRTLESFTLEASIDSSARTLTFASVPEATTSSRRPAVASDEFARTIRAGGVDEIVWSHGAIGEVVSVRLGRTRAIGISIGHYHGFGTYRFTALSGLASEAPAIVADALAPLLAHSSMRQTTPPSPT